MIAILFLAIGALFFWMAFNAYSSQEIKGREWWGFGVRTYQRDNEPTSYWATLAAYLVTAITTTVVGAVAAFRLLSNQ